MAIKIALQPQQAFLGYLIEKSRASWIGYGGSRGGGKSGAIRRIMLNRRAKHPHTDGQILRRVWDDVEKNHINKMWEEFPALHDYYKATSHVIELPESLGGGKIFFSAAENAIDVERKAFGPEFYDIMVDQAEQFTERELSQLKTTCRWPGVPDGSCKFILPFNPGGVGAAFLQRVFYLKDYHEREIPEDYVFLQAYGWDNVEWSRAALAADGYVGDCLGHKCGKCGPCVYYSWDSETRFKYYTTRSQYGQEQNRLPAHMRAGQLLGDFKKFSGQYFSNFDEAVHKWELGDIDFKPWWPVWGSLDWGYQHSSSFHWHTQAGYVNDKGESKRLVITFREFLADHLSERALAEEICAINGDLKLSNIYAGHDLWKKDNAGETKEQAMSKVFVSHGLPSLKKAAIDRVDGWRFLHRALDEGEWIITGNCKMALRALPVAVFDEKKNNEDILKTNTPEDDVLDELRYGLYSQFAVRDVPLNVKIAERSSHLTDRTNRNILIMRLNAEQDRKVRNAGLVNNRASSRYRRFGS
ncbi:phage terminase large subunit [Patescibacteria group bacterium]|nr:phage terminase large subunit [Patescibacteria group bacterium]